MKNLAIILFFMFATSYIQAQNLVPNPSFEDTVSCPINGNLNNVNLWVNPNSATPDYFHICTFGNFGVPVNGYGNQSARTGNAYAGVISIMNISGYREYLQVQLTSPLSAGVKYCVEFYVMAADSSTYSINNIGAYLSNVPISSPSSNEFTVTPQIENQISSPINQPNVWQLVTDSFIATGGEQYITIGNFNNNSNTDTTMLNGSTWAEGYQYIDDVKLQTCSTVNIDETLLVNQISLYSNPSNGKINISSHETIKNYTVYSSLGQLIINNFPNTTNFQIDLTNYSTGIYYINMQTTKSNITKKIIIN